MPSQPGANGVSPDARYCGSSVGAGGGGGGGVVVGGGDGDGEFELPPPQAPIASTISIEISRATLVAFESMANPRSLQLRRKSSYNELRSLSSFAGGLMSPARPALFAAMRMLSCQMQAVSR